MCNFSLIFTPHTGSLAIKSCSQISALEHSGEASGAEIWLGIPAGVVEGAKGTLVAADARATFVMVGGRLANAELCADYWLLEARSAL